MKIDILINGLGMGGAERVAVNLAKSWHAAGKSVRVITHVPTPPLGFRPPNSVQLIQTNGGNAISRILKLRKILRKSDSSVIVAIQGNMAIEAAIAAKGLKLRIVGCEHSTPSRSIRGGFWKFLRPYAYNILSCVVTLTDGAAVELRALCPRARVVVIPNSIELPLEDRPPSLSVSEIVNPNAELLLTAGRFIEAKGYDRLIELFSQLASERPNVQLVILGDGPQRELIKSKISQLRLEGLVHLPGSAGNMADWYRRANIYVMTSRWEGFPMTLMEALAHGVPSVVTKFNHGASEIIRHEIDGFIFQDHVDSINPSMWSAQISSLLQNSELLSQMSRNAREIVHRYGERNVLQQWENLFQELQCA